MSSVQPGDFARINSELRAKRLQQGLPGGASVQTLVQTQFQSLPNFGTTVNAELLHSNPGLKRIDLVVQVPAVTVASGSLAWVNDVSNIIENCQVFCGGQVIAYLTGNQIGIINKSRASPNGLAALEATTLVDQTLTQRQNAVAVAKTFTIHLPLFVDDAVCPYLEMNTNIQVQVTFKNFALCVEGGGTGSCSMTSAYLMSTFLAPATDQESSIDDAIVQQVAGAANGVDMIYRDGYVMQQLVPSGTTQQVIQLNQLRNNVKQITFYMVANSDLQTNYACKPFNFLPISTVQFNIAGNNIGSQAPIPCAYLRDVQCVQNGFQNFVGQEVYPYIPDGATEGDDYAPLDLPYGGGIPVGPAFTGSPIMTLTFPSAVAANSTLFIIVECWNAMRYSGSAGQLQMMRVLS